MYKQLIADRFLQTLEGIECGQFEILTPEGKRYIFRGIHPGSQGRLIIHDWSVIKNLVTKGDIGFAEDYRDGLWDTDDLSGLLLVGLQNEEALLKYIYGGAFARALSRLSYLFTRNTVKGSKRNIHSHYDLGNDFYSLWLDQTMTYSGAIFNDVNESLEQAQFNKYDRILDVLGNNSGRLLEVGCGWGGFAEHAIASNNDYSVKGITLSKEQQDYAQKRLNGQADIVLEDYRYQSGQYDSIVSIEMFEAVGERFWPTYFNKMKSLMSRKGKAIVQTITIDDKYFESYRRGGDMIRTFIFPGGMLPSPERFENAANQYGLNVSNRYDFGLDYATTLEFWLRAFDSKHKEIMCLGFDDKFIRIWRFYLAACIASFKVKRTSVMQVELQHA